MLVARFSVWTYNSGAPAETLGGAQKSNDQHSIVWRYAHTVNLTAVIAETERCNWIRPFCILSQFSAVSQIFRQPINRWNGVNEEIKSPEDCLWSISLWFHHIENSLASWIGSWIWYQQTVRHFSSLETLKLRVVWSWYIRRLVKVLAISSSFSVRLKHRWVTSIQIKTFLMLGDAIKSSDSDALRSSRSGLHLGKHLPFSRSILCSHVRIFLQFKALLNKQVCWVIKFLARRLRI